jgi:hypothetical protein
MERSIEELVLEAHRDPGKGLGSLAAASKEAIDLGDVKRARPLVMALLTLSIEHSAINAADRDLVEWLLGQGTSLQLVLWAVIFARRIGDLPLEQRALSLAPTAPLAS